MTEMIRTDLAAWTARVTSVAETIKDDTVIGFHVTVKYYEGEPRANTFYFPPGTSMAHLLVGNEITICLEGRS